MEIKQLAAELSQGLGLEPHDVDLFELRAEERWAAELALAYDLFVEEELAYELEWQRARLRVLCSYFAELEEFERCSALQRVERALFAK